MVDTVMYKYCSHVDDTVMHKFCSSIEDQEMCKYCSRIDDTVMCRYCSSIDDTVMCWYCGSIDDTVMCRYCSIIFGCSSTLHSHFFKIALGKFDFLFECFSFLYKSLAIILRIVILTSKASIAKNMLPDN